ncbi:epidermal growth factor-like protein 7 [Hypomesus transpacificus]|uniref:epidermal growth factor-like protein 7 n=1 Tax=Hypomesus transpacificus TaxID=137520 RepID=UPI001F07B7AD|nr:epidermal growth factor-like protein 7 [Hypomesus transpacificus]XP_046900699.1 epidermal growth factor-like protein 7 [Hypomesus transpacificus]
MYQTLLLSSSLFILHVAGTPQFLGHHGRRVCSRDVRHSRVVTATESYIQPVHKPYITLCQGHRLCSTYKTVYRLSYRQVTKATPLAHIYPECCPGWRRLHSHNCNQAVCGEACVNGGTCLRPNHCACPLGWTGRLCQTDVDECSEQHPCPQTCVNTAGSYRCACREGSSLAADGRSCRSHPPTPPPPPLPPAPTTQRSQAKAEDSGASSNDSGFGLAENVTEEVQILKNRVELLEQKLQLVLAPFNSLFPLSLDEGMSEKTTFLSHSFQQLDRIDSLSEQIGFLEERLGTCSCQEN